MFGELRDTGEKRLRKGRMGTSHPAQPLTLTLAWEHPCAAGNQEFTGSAKPLSVFRPRSCGGAPRAPEWGRMWTRKTFI